MIRTRKTQSRIYLFARPSFLTGIARILDPLGTLNEYNTSQEDQLADYRALRSDWSAVGDDLKTAVQQYEDKGLASHDE